MLLKCMEKNVRLLVEKLERFQELRICNFNQIINVAYRRQPNKIDFEFMDKIIFRIMKHCYSDAFD
jgi:hypothetical protein